MINNPFSLLGVFTIASEAERRALKMMKVMTALMLRVSDRTPLLPDSDAVNEAVVKAGEAVQETLTALQCGNIEDAYTAAQDAAKAAETAEVWCSTAFIKVFGGNPDMPFDVNTNAHLFIGDLDNPSDDNPPPQFPSDEDMPPYSPFEDDDDELPAWLEDELTIQDSKQHNDAEDIQPTPATAEDLVNRIDSMLPTMKADEERTARLNAALRRRREGLQLHPVEIIADLRDTLDTLIRHINEYQGRVNRHLKTPAQLLAYAERAALYVGRDYPREMDDDRAVTGLWDAFDKIHTAARAWRTGEYPENAAASVIASIHRTASDAFNGLSYFPSDEDSEADDE